MVQVPTGQWRKYCSIESVWAHAEQLLKMRKWLNCGRSTLRILRTATDSASAMQICSTAGYTRKGK